MRKLIVISVFIVLAGCSREWNGKVRYVVNGSSDNVSIYYSDDWMGVTVDNISLPFDSGAISVDAHDDSPFHAYLKVTNKSATSEEFDMYIFIDNKEKAHRVSQVKSGASVILDYDVEMN